MKFEVDIDKLIEDSINLNQFLLCQFIYLQESKLLNNYINQFNKFVTKADFDLLVDKGYLGMHQKDVYSFTNAFVTKKFINRFIEKPSKSKLEKESVEDWIDGWYNLFPKGVKSGGYLVRSSRIDCINKMVKFVKKYPQYSKDIILKATADYIDYYRLNNWKYMSLAHYFISKNDVSALASACDNILEKIESGKEVDLSVDKYKYEGEHTEEFGMDRL